MKRQTRFYLRIIPLYLGWLSIPFLGFYLTYHMAHGWFVLIAWAFVSYGVYETCHVPYRKWRDKQLRRN